MISIVLDMMKKPSFAHVINSFITQPGHHLNFAQQVTVLSMKKASQFSQNTVNVGLYTAQFPEDSPAVPPDFITTPDLTRSFRDITSNDHAAKLPLLTDILNALVISSSADYLIYSNLDIALMPNFYETVQAIADAGHDAFVINRRTISNDYQRLEDLPYMYAEPGELHRGWDCFIFRRGLLPLLELDQVCIGAPLVGLVFYANLAVYAENFKEFTDLHLTFHLGDDRVWSQPKHEPALIHNRKIALKILSSLQTKFPGKFNKFHPLTKYLRWHQNPLLSSIYDDILMRIFIPARYTRWNRG